TKWKFIAAAAVAVTAVGGTAAWAAADDAGTEASDYVDGLDAVTDDFTDHARELGGPLCDGCDNSDNTDLVVMWQAILVTDGFLATEDPMDGYFGPDTKRATAMWQDEFGVEQTGEVDADTWAEASSHLTQTGDTVYYAKDGAGETRFTRHDDGTYTLNKVLIPGKSELVNEGGERIEFYTRTVELVEV
ncbi:MAG: peptidoglycan-binding protein, partial [Stackebrandtia sp.]